MRNHVDYRHIIGPAWDLWLKRIDSVPTNPVIPLTGKKVAAQ